MGVARCRIGSGGRDDTAPPAPTAAMPPTGLTLGDGGIARPSRGVRVPLLERAPGMAGRRRGAGDDMMGMEDVGWRGVTMGTDVTSVMVPRVCMFVVNGGQLAFFDSAGRGYKKATWARKAAHGQSSAWNPYILSRVVTARDQGLVLVHLDALQLCCAAAESEVALLERNCCLIDTAGYGVRLGHQQDDTDRVISAVG